MQHIIALTMKGIIRDRIFQGIMVAAILFLAIPKISSLSMRQVTEMSITLGLSLFSFILMLLAIFLGATSLWRDVDRRYVNSILGLPLSRYEYVIGRFLGTAMFLVAVGSILILFVLADAWLGTRIYPPSKSVEWLNIVTAAGFQILKSILVVGIAFLLSSVSTSFFLPVFGTICIYFVGSASQDVHEFLTAAGESLKTLPSFVTKTANVLYYVLPNLGSFDFKLHAIYSLPITGRAIVLTGGYFLLYTAIIVLLSAIVFGRRELR